MASSENKRSHAQCAHAKAKSKVSETDPEQIETFLRVEPANHGENPEESSSEQVQELKGNAWAASNSHDAKACQETVVIKRQLARSRSAHVRGNRWVSAWRRAGLVPKKLRPYARPMVTLTLCVCKLSKRQHSESAPKDSHVDAAKVREPRALLGDRVCISSLDSASRCTSFEGLSFVFGDSGDRSYNDLTAAAVSRGPLRTNYHTAITPCLRPLMVSGHFVARGSEELVFVRPMLDTGSSINLIKRRHAVRIVGEDGFETLDIPKSAKPIGAKSSLQLTQRFTATLHLNCPNSLHTTFYVVEEADLSHVCMTLGVGDSVRIMDSHLINKNCAKRA